MKFFRNFFPKNPTSVPYFTGEKLRGEKKYPKIEKKISRKFGHNNKIVLLCTR